MKQLAILLIILLLVCTAQATETRVKALGNTENYMEDDINIINFPGTLSNHTNLTIYEFGSQNDGGSAILTYHSNDLNLNFALLLEQKLDYVIPSANSNETMTKLLIGRGNFTIYGGVAGKLSSHESDFNSIDLDETSSLYLSTGLGYSTKGKTPVDLGLHVTVRGKEALYQRSSIPYDSSFTVNNTGVKFFMRSSHKVGKGVLRPFLNANYYFDDTYYSVINNYNVEKLNLDTYYYYAELGVSYEVLLREKNKLWFGLVPLKLDYSTSERDYGQTPLVNNRKYTNTLNDMTIFIAMESRITSWLSTRIALKSMYRYLTNKVESPSGGASSSDSAWIEKDYSVHYGLALHYKKFTMDVAVNPDVLYNGPHFVSGYVTENMVSNISLSYQW